jgi:integrase
MARRLKDATLDTREARGKLKPQGKPYWRAIERGLHVGYRRLKGKAGTWWARHYLGEQTYQTEPLGNADDLSDADGVAILSFWQAQDKARERMVARAHTAAGKAGPYTVADALDAYIDFLDNEGRSATAASDARYRDRAFIRPKLGEVELAELTSERLRAWRNALAKSAPRLRTKAGEKQKHREAADSDEARRARQASANRIWTTLRAALNRAFETDKVDTDKAWRKVKPFRSVDAARVRYLTVAEAKRLVNAADPEFRPLVIAGLQTGARYSELARLIVGDFNPDSGTVHILKSKSGKDRHVVLTEEGAAFFKRQAAGRPGDALMFTHDGSAWNTAHQSRPMREACEHASIKNASFHTLRHTWASLSVMNGTPLMVVAKNLGHADTRMVEKHYGHLAPSFVAEAIRAGAPRFGLKPSNVATLR